jgi:hypothetical protein
MLRASDQDVALNTERNRLITMIEGMQTSNTLLEFVMDSLRNKLRQEEGQPVFGFGVQVPGGAVSHQQAPQQQPAHLGHGGQHQQAAQPSTNIVAAPSEPATPRNESRDSQSSTLELSPAGQHEVDQPVSSAGRSEEQVQAQPAFSAPKPRRPMGGNALSAMGQ